VHSQRGYSVVISLHPLLQLYGCTSAANAYRLLRLEFLEENNTSFDFYNNSNSLAGVFVADSVKY